MLCTFTDQMSMDYTDIGKHSEIYCIGEVMITLSKLLEPEQTMTYFKNELEEHLFLPKVIKVLSRF